MGFSPRPQSADSYLQEHSRFVSASSNVCFGAWRAFGGTALGGPCCGEDGIRPAVIAKVLRIFRDLQRLGIWGLLGSVMRCVLDPRIGPESSQSTASPLLRGHSALSEDGFQGTVLLTVAGRGQGCCLAPYSA